MNETENYLAHHGIIGMRWGVRHTKEYLNARRGEKLIRTADKKRRKADRLENKARNSRYGITDTGRTVWENRQIKAGKAARKADKAEKKAEKWIAKHGDLLVRDL